jgi:hypothetical protein
VVGFFIRPDGTAAARLGGVHLPHRVVMTRQSVHAPVGAHDGQLAYAPAGHVLHPVGAKRLTGVGLRVRHARVRRARVRRHASAATRPLRRRLSRRSYAPGSPSLLTLHRRPAGGRRTIDLQEPGGDLSVA